MSMHSLEKVQDAKKKIATAVEQAAANPGCRVHVGTGNGKTDAINEGTAPLVTCCERACATCGRECFAVWHIAILYPAVLKNKAENTIIRRRDAKSYYAKFFASAIANDCGLVRVNESGDFENAEQVRALFEIAGQFPTIQVIGYTRRHELAEIIAQAPSNVHIRYSLYRDGDADGDALRSCNCAAVHDSITTCPAQIAAKNGKKWTCAMCAANGCGCASNRALIVFRAH